MLKCVHNILTIQRGTLFGYGIFGGCPPEYLLVVEAVIDPEPVKQKPRDWHCIRQEVSEQLDFEPAIDTALSEMTLTFIWSSLQ